VKIRLAAARALVGISLLTGLSGCIFTSPDTPVALLRVSKGEQTIAPNATAPVPLTVSVRDQNGDPAEGVTITWTIRSGSGTLSATETSTNDDGETSITFTAGSTVGTTVVNAIEPVLGAAVGFTFIVQ
jgi:hypothetical protein